jgi:hypothetical protein
LKDNLELASSYSLADELVAVLVFFVSPHLEIGKETFDSLFERDSMRSKFVILEIIFKV